MPIIIALILAFQISVTASSLKTGEDRNSSQPIETNETKVSPFNSDKNQPSGKEFFEKESGKEELIMLFGKIQIL